MAPCAHASWLTTVAPAPVKRCPTPSTQRRRSAFPIAQHRARATHYRFGECVRLPDLVHAEVVAVLGLEGGEAVVFVFFPRWGQVECRRVHGLPQKHGQCACGDEATESSQRSTARWVARLCSAVARARGAEGNWAFKTNHHHCCCHGGRCSRVGSHVRRPAGCTWRAREAAV